MSAEERYEEACRLVEEAVRRVFPDAAPIEGWGGPAWAAPRPAGAPVANETGTYDPTRTVVGLAPRKAGPTLYFLDPGDYFIPDKHRAALEGAGLKVMRGCIVHSRKIPFPIGPVEALFRDVRERDHAARKPSRT